MPPKNVKFDFAGVDKLYLKLHHGLDEKGNFGKSLLSPYYGVSLVGCDMEAMIEDVSLALFKKTYAKEFEDVVDNVFDVRTRRVPKGVKPDTCYSALRSLMSAWYGRKLDVFLASEICWRLAAGFRMMAQGKHLAKAFAPFEPYWTGVRIEDCHHTSPSREGKPMLDLMFRLYDGVFAGMKFTQRIPYRFVVAKLARDIGMPVYEKIHKNELVKCHFAGLMAYEEGSPKLVEFHSSMAVNKYNRDLRKDRLKPCMRGFRWLCHQCTLGHLRIDDSESSKVWCNRGTHSRTFEKKDCPRCKKNTWFDPSLFSSVCIECKHRAAIEAIKAGA